MTDSILRSVSYYSTATSIPFPASLLLDAYTGATVAYSYRKLRTAYAGSAVRIRRSSDSAEQNVGFSGNDFDTATAASFIGGGTGFVVTWFDQSGNGYDVTQATTGQQPTYSATGIGTMPASLFTSGSSTRLRTVVDSVAFNSIPASLFIRSYVTAGSNSDARIFSFAASGFNDFSSLPSFNLQRGPGSGNNYLGQRNSLSIGGIAETDGTAYRVSLIFDGTNGTIRLNNASPSTTAFTAALGGTVATINVGCSASGGSFITGGISEIVFWPSDQTANRTSINADQLAYWGT